MDEFILTDWLRFTRPGWLAACGLAVAPVVLAVALRQRAAVWRVALQCAALLLAGVALGGPELRLGGGQLPWAMVQDVSGSMRDQHRAPATLPEGVPVERYRFAAGVARDEPVAANATRISPALRLAVARSDELGGVAIVTDGQFADDWRSGADAVGRTGLGVLIAPAEAPPPDARLASLRARRRADGSVALRADLTTNAPQRRRLRIVREGDRPGVLLDRRVELLAGVPASFPAVDDPPADGATRYRASLSPGDAFAENDAASAVVLGERARTAIVAASPGMVRRWLIGTGDAETQVVSPADAPADALGWAGYDAVILADAAGTLLDRPRREALADYVRGGGGLVLIGAGPHGSPADRDDALNRVAPLIANPFRRRPMDMTVVLDASGSMALPAAASAGDKFAAAVEAVLALDDHLTAADTLEVIAFSGRPRVVYDSAADPPDFSALADALRGVRASGQTDVGPALKAAMRRPSASPRRKFVLVLSDLATAPFDVDAVAALAAERQASLAVVAVRSGEDADAAPLEALAQRVGAPLIRRDTLTGLAELFARLLREARGDAVRRADAPFQSQWTAPPFGVEIGRPPTLDSYILCAAAPDAEVIARVGHDPILARRRVGMGRAVSLAVPFAGDNNARWWGWAELPRLAETMRRWARRPGGDPRFTAEVDRSGGRVRVAVRAADDDGPMNMLDLTLLARAIGGDEVRSAPMAQTAPGAYAADLPVGEAAVTLEIVRDAGVVWYGASAGRTASEYARIGPDWETLNELARRTGGRIVSRRSLPAWVSPVYARRYRPISAALILAALALMLIDWAAGRIARRGA